MGVFVSCLIQCIREIDESSIYNFKWKSQSVENINEKFHNSFALVYVVNLNWAKLCQCLSILYF